MAPCCGRPNNRQKKSGSAGYYEKYAYLSSHQKEQQVKVSGSKCESCDALTMGDPCTVCGNPKQINQEEPG